MKNKFRFLKKPRNIIFIVIGLLIIGGIFYSLKPKNPNLSANAATVKKGNIVQTVSVSGKVKPTEAVDLSFERSGRIQNINVSVGDKVAAGQILASLSNTDSYAQLQQAQAQLDNQKAQLEALKKGTRDEEIKISESDLKKSQQDLANIYDDTPVTLSSSYSKADDSVRKQAATLFYNPQSANPTLNFLTYNPQNTSDAILRDILANKELITWQTEVNSSNFDQTQNSYDQKLQSAINHLEIISKFINACINALNDSANLGQTALDTNKTNLTAARTAINAAMTEVNSQIQSVAAQKILVEKYQNQLALQKAGSTPEQIAAQAAQVKNAEANLLNYQAQLEKTYVRAPINGVVTKQSSEKGEIVSANVPFISIISDAQFEIEANIPEADIAKIEAKDPASVTLDAYGDDIVFNAVVTKIDPAETVLEGVATYKTTFHFINKDERVRSGMTANIDIETAKKSEVLYVPQRAVFTENKEKFVKIINADNKTTSDIQVQTGLRSSDGNIEIISGLKEGDKILTVLQ